LSHFKLFSSKAKADKQRALEAQTRNNAPLNAQVASGIGIIGVKFVLAFGRPPVINRVFPGTPAAVVGLRNNDVIVAVDGIPTYGLTKEEVYQMIVGSPGTPVTVTVSRNGDYVPRTMNRMDFNDITDPIVRRDYLMSI
jgi:C-terminal processing protease CtpA/Prc